MSGPASPDAEGGSLLLAERFGPTVQGEGPRCGEQAIFVRLSRCNLNCLWCDSRYTWDWEQFDPHAESSYRTVAEIVEWLLVTVPKLIVITGGEPLLQQRRGLVELVDRLLAAGRQVEFETNATVVPLPELIRPGVRLIASPKLANTGIQEARRIVPRALTSMASIADTGHAVFKFVAADPRDLEEIDGLVERFGLAPVWVMPEGRTPDAVEAGLRALADPVIARGWNLSPRLHISAWGDVRGR